MTIAQYVHHYAANTVGRDFAVGDIHGCFTALERALADIGFDESRDRLFSVGDLVDRGPESNRVLEFTAKPWFHAVQGNHEDMAIRYVTPGNRDRDHYMLNGGAWLIGSTPNEQLDFATELATLPYAIEVETANGLIGIVHAECATPTWREMTELFASVTSKNRLRALTDTCLWSRDRIQSEDRTTIPDVLAVIVGHTPLRKPAILGNVYYIDTGAVFGNHLTLIDLETLQTVPPMAPKIDWEGA